MAEEENLITIENGDAESTVKYGATKATNPPGDDTGGDATAKVGGNEVAPPKPFRSNRYATKKTAGQGLLGVSLITSNTSHLKTTLDKGPSTDYYYLLTTMLIMSLVLQLVVGVLLLMIGSKESKIGVDKSRGTKKMEKWNNLSTLLMFVITMLNAALGAFILNSSTESVPSTTKAPSVNGSQCQITPPTCIQ